MAITQTQQARPSATSEEERKETSSSDGAHSPTTPTPLPERKEHGVVLEGEVVDVAEHEERKKKPASYAAVVNGSLLSSIPEGKENEFATPAKNEGANRSVKETVSDVFYTTADEEEDKRPFVEVKNKSAEKSERRKHRLFNETRSEGEAQRSSESETEKMRARRRPARRTSIYKSVVSNSPPPTEVRGQSVRDDIAAAADPLKTREAKDRIKSMLKKADFASPYRSTPGRVVHRAEEEALLQALASEYNAGPDPARAAELGKEIATLISKRAARVQKWHDEQDKKADEAAAAAATAAAASESDTSVGSHDFQDGLADVGERRKREIREERKKEHETKKPSPSTSRSVAVVVHEKKPTSEPEGSDDESSDHWEKKREQRRKERRAGGGKNVPPPPSPPPSDDESSSETSSSSSSDERSRKQKKSSRKNKARCSEKARRKTAGSSSEDDSTAKKRSSAKVPPLSEKYSGADPSARTLARFSRSLRAYLLASSVDPDSLAAAAHIGAALTSRASEVFSHVVLRDVNEQFLPGKGHRPSPWSYASIIQLLKERFVSVTAVQDAQRQFRELRQWRKNGLYMPVNELAMRLEELGEEKYEVTQWELKRTFLDALDPSIASKTFPMFAADFEDRKVTFQMVVAEAIVQEQVWMQEMAAKEARNKGSALSNYEAFSSTGIQSRLVSKEGRKGVQFSSMRTPLNQNRQPSNNNLSRPQRGRRNPPKKRNNRPPRSEAEEKLFQERKSAGTCYGCGKSNHFARDCPEAQKNPAHASMLAGETSDEEVDDGIDVVELNDDELIYPDTDDEEDEEEEDEPEMPEELALIRHNPSPSPKLQSQFAPRDSPFPKTFRVPVGVAGVDGHCATIDNGSSATFIHPTTALVRKLKILKYDVPKTLKLGTKGSKSKILAFCFAELRVGRVKKRQRFEIAQVEDKVLLGRDFLRAHNCSIQFNPDVLIIGSAEEKKLPAHPSDEDLADVRLGEMKTAPASEKVSEKSKDPAVVAANGKWDDLCTEYGDVLRGENAPLKAPPYRNVMHSIPFTVPERVEARRIVYKFPEKFVEAFNKVCDAHVAAGIWIPATSEYADPMIPLMKSDGVTPRPVVDLRRRNLITKKLQMPVVDQDHIINAVAGAKFVSTADIEGAFQQIRIKDEDVPKTAFSTPRGIYYSVAAQQGDCNSTVSLHNAVTEVLRGLTGVFYYADDIYICSDSLEEHVATAEAVLKRFREHQFYLKKTKFRFLAEERDVLGRRVRKGEISIHPNKGRDIASLKRPKYKEDLQSIIGILGFCSRHIPNYAQLLAPLTELTGNVPFRWSKTCIDSFAELKRLAAKNIKLTCIIDSELADRSTKPEHHADPPPGYEGKNDAPGKYLFLFTDASLVGCGSALTVGTNWWKSDLVSLQSRKFNSAQANYPTHEAELQAVYEALCHFESKLLGRKFIVCTDNTALSAFMTSKRLNGRQARIWTYMAPFDLLIEYIKGERNVIADLMSREHEEEEEEKSADVPQLAAMHPEGRARRAHRAPRRFDDEDFDLGRRKNAPSNPPPPAPARPAVARVVHDEEDAPRQKRKYQKNVAAHNEKVRNARKAEEWDAPEVDAINLDPAYDDDLRRAIRDGYLQDEFLAKIWENESEFRSFGKASEKGTNGPKYLYRLTPEMDRPQICLPNSTVRGRKVREVFLEHAHETTGHSGAKGTHEWLTDSFWWPGLTRDVEDYCRTCPSCQQTKPTNALPAGKLHTIPVPARPYESLGIDFQGPFPPSKYGEESVTYLWNFVDRLTGECILLPCSEKGLTSKKCAELFFRIVYPQWGVPKEFLPDQDVRWRSEFWREFCKLLGTTLSMSTSYHPQSNGRIERLHRDLNQILRQFVNDSQDDRAEAIPFAQFALNSRRSGTTGFSPFELSRLQAPRNLPGFDLSPSVPLPVRRVIENAEIKLEKAKDAIEKARVQQTIAANKKRRDDPLPLNELNGENNDESNKSVPPLLYVSSKNLHAVPSRARKLLPLFVGPFPVLSYSPRTSTYVLDLPERYTARGYSNRFHASQVRRSFPSDEKRWPGRVTNTVPVFPLDAVLTEDPIVDYSESPLFPEFGETPAFLARTPSPRLAGIDVLDPSLFSLNDRLSATPMAQDTPRPPSPVTVDSPPRFVRPAPTPATPSRDQDLPLLNESHVEIESHSVRGGGRFVFELNQSYLNKKGEEKKKVVSVEREDAKRRLDLENTMAMAKYLRRMRKEKILDLKSNFADRSGPSYRELREENVKLADKVRHLEGIECERDSFASDVQRLQGYITDLEDKLAAAPNADLFYVYKRHYDICETASGANRLDRAGITDEAAGEFLGTKFRPTSGRYPPTA